MRWIALSLAVAACSTAPIATAPEPGTEAIWLTTQPWLDELTARPGGGWGSGALSHREPVPGAACTASNDRGSWTVVTPGSLQVARSTTPLAIACRREGYLESRIELRCLTPGERARIEGAVVARGLMPLGLVGIVALPLVAAGAGADAAMLNQSSAAAVAGSGPDCTYSGGREVQVPLRAAGR